MEKATVLEIIDVSIGLILLFLIFTFVEERYVLNTSYLVCIAMCGWRYLRVRKNTD
ncbi:MAG: hypothetical protein RSE91_00140 [Bacilli bacterium]